MKKIPLYENKSWDFLDEKHLSQDKNFIIEQKGYSLHPNIIIGDEMNFTAIFQHPKESKYLFRIEIEDFSEIFEVKGIDSFFDMHQRCSQLMQDHFNTLISMEALKDD